MVEYIIATNDGEVTERGEVQVVEVDQVERRKTYSLDYFDNKISNIDKQLAALTSQRAEYEALRLVVEVKVNKVILKVKEIM